MRWRTVRWTPTPAWSVSWRGSCASLDTPRGPTHYDAEPPPRTEVSLNVALAPVVRGHPRRGVFLRADRGCRRPLRAPGGLPRPPHTDRETGRPVRPRARAPALRHRERPRPGE